MPWEPGRGAANHETPRGSLDQAANPQGISARNPTSSPRTMNPYRIVGFSSGHRHEAVLSRFQVGNGLPFAKHQGCQEATVDAPQIDTCGPRMKLRMHQGVVPEHDVGWTLVPAPPGIAPSSRSRLPPLRDRPDRCQHLRVRLLHRHPGKDPGMDQTNTMLRQIVPKRHVLQQAPILLPHAIRQVNMIRPKTNDGTVLLSSTVG